MTQASDPAADCSGHYDDDATLLSGAGIGEPRYCDGTCSPARDADAQDKAPRVSIQPGMMPDLTVPYPYSIEADGSVAGQDYWRGDPATLIGFQREQQVKHVDLLCEDFLADPQRAVGMFPVFAREGGEIYVLKTPIVSIGTGAATNPAT